MKIAPSLRFPLIAGVIAMIQLATTGTSAHAAVIPLVNPGFDLGPTVYGAPGWVGTGLIYGSAPGIYTTPPATSPNFMIMNTAFTSSAMYQDLTLATYTVHEGDIFQLTVAIGSNSGGGIDTPPDSSYYDGFIHLRIDGVSVASFTAITPTVIPSAGFLDVVFTYTATAADDGKSIGVGFTSTNSNRYYDNIRLETIPEPSVAAMSLFAAAMGFVLRKSRRQV